MDSAQSKNVWRQPAKLPQKLPVKQSDRKSTDWCCSIVGAIFAIAMFTLACVFFNKLNFINHYYPITGANHPCLMNNYMHMPDPNNFDTRQCVVKCPENFISTDSRVCLPKDDKLKAKYLANPKFTRPIDYLGFVQTIVYVLILTISWGLLRMTIANCFPRYMPILSYVTAIIVLLGIAIVSFTTNIVWNKLGYLAYAFGGVLVLLAFIIIVMLCLYSNQVKFQGYMLEYSVKFLNQNTHTFLYIPFFIVFHTGLVLLILFQHFSFASHQFTTPDLWRFNLGEVLQILTLIEYFWGLQFLKDAYNYCVSGNAVDWYWTGKSNCCAPVKRLLCKSWGSVVAGSFLNAFLEIPTLISELIVCHPGTCCSRLGVCCYSSCDCLGFFFELVRTDAYSYITLTGVPFLDAASQCSKLCEKSRQFVGYHSAMKHHRLAAHIASVSFIFCWAFWILSYRTVNYNIWNVGILIVLIYANISPFIGIHTDAAQGLQTSYLAELELQGEHQYLQKLLPSVRKILQPRQNRVQGDGNC